jgi:hypothetical protein
MPHITNIRTIIQRADILWPKSIPLDFSNFSSLYIEFCIGAREPEFIFMSPDRFSDYWEDIGTKAGERLGGRKVLDGVMIEGARFRNAIIVLDSKLTDNNMRIVMYYDKEATDNINSLESVGKNS